MTKQSKTDATSLDGTFNDVAGKIVSYKELRERTNAIYKTELSLGEKLFLNLVDRPGSLILGTILAVKDAITNKKRPATYVDTQPFPPKMYVTGAFMASIIKDATRLSITPGWDAKMVRLTKRAFDACQDFSQTPKMQALKPV